MNRALAIIFIILFWHAVGFMYLFNSGCTPKNHISHPVKVETDAKRAI